MSSSWYFLDVPPEHVKRERQRAQKLKKSQWWQTKRNQGVCHYCNQKVAPSEITMDHIVPVARGGRSQPGNVVPSCRPCNASKKLDTPVDSLLNQMPSSSGLGDGA